MAACIRPMHVIHVAILLSLLIQTVDTNYDFSCPSRSQWMLRTNTNCNNNSHYHCLLDTNRKRRIEICLHPAEYTTGRMAVYSGKLNAVLCSSIRYMPFIFVSSMSDECLYQKSNCNEEGQILHENRSTTCDTSCLCDFTKGYAYVTTPKNTYYCVPSEEDCSCYKTLCADTEKILSSDYTCMQRTQHLYGTQFHVAIPQYKVLVAKEPNTSWCQSSLKYAANMNREIYVTVGFVVAVMALLVTVVLVMACSEFSIINEEEVFHVNLGSFKMECDLKGKYLKKGYSKNFTKEPRILDMCFVTIQNKIFLIFIDADNNCIVKRSITDHVPPEIIKIANECKVNRMAKITNKLIAVIYKSNLDIIIYDVSGKLKLYTRAKVPEENLKFPNYGIQGIAFLDDTYSESGKQIYTFILSNRSVLYKCEMELNEKESPVTIHALVCNSDFQTARRFAVSKNEKLVFIADEDEKKITTIGFSGTFHDSLEGHNRGLQNLRAIAITDRKLYAATSAGISVYSFSDNDRFKFADGKYKMILQYKQHVEHTRGLCLEKCGDSIYIGVSCVRREQDFIAVFGFKETREFC